MKLKSVLLAGASVLAMTVHAHADPASIGSLIISAFLSVGAGSLLPVASAAAIGLSAIGAAVTAANLAFTFMGSRAKANPQDIKNTSKGSESPGRHAFGRVRMAGEINFGNTAGYNLYRHLLHSFGPIVAIEEYFYDGRSITVEDNGDVSSPPWANAGGSNLRVQWKPGNGAEAAWPELIADFPSLWSANHRVRGIGQTLLCAVNPGTGHDRFPRLFQGGLKELEALARVGLFYDPRTGSSAWTMNGVLICLHYFRRQPGMRDELIDFVDIGAVASQAEALVPTLTGTAPRCQLSGGWKGPLTSDTVGDMLESAGLEVRHTVDGRYTFRFVEDNPASEATYTTQHILETYPQAGPEALKRPNVCRLRYFSPLRNFEVADIDLSGAPWARVESEIERYGEQEMLIELVFCPDPSQAQRIARRMFHTARADFGLTNMNFAGITTRGLKTITIEVPDIGADGGSEFLKVRKGTARVNDGEGRVEIPFQIIPDELKVAWNPATMEVPPPPEMPELQYESDLDTPAMPADAVQVVYPGGAREVRVLFSGVVGGTVAEATRRTYAAGIPQPWASMVEYQVGGQWYAFAAVNYEGLDVDFRVRFFNEAEEGSYWSPQLARRPVTVNNLPPAAPAVEREDDGGIGPSYNFRFIVGASLNVASTYLQYSDSPSGPWTLVASANSRPGDVSGWITVLMPEGFGWTRYVRAVSFASDGVANTPSAVIAVFGPTP